MRATEIEEPIVSLFEPNSKGPQHPQQPYPPAGPGQPNWQAQGGPQGQPDWQALADAHENSARRKRLLAVGGAVIGALAVIGGAFALVGGGSGGGHRPASADGSQGTVANGGPGSGRTSAAAGASGAASGTASPGAPSGSAAPSASSSKNPGSASASASASASTPLVPLNAGAVLYAQQLFVGNRAYKRVLTDEKVPCWTGTTGHLGNALAPNSCAQLLRATWVSGNEAVSVGVAVLPSAGAAQAANAAYVGHIEPLHGGPAPGFCPDSSPCALAHGVVGHFTYYVIAGPVGGAPGVDDPAARAAATRLAAFAVQALSRQK